MKSMTLFKSVAVAAVMAFASGVSAQMVGGSVFLKGNYVEAGICDIGDFGAATPPAGYHPHATSSGGGALGFVADPAMDGWGTGTPAYVGDYFVPGYPFEGWNLQIGAVRAQAHSCMGFTGTGLTGANVSYSAVGSEVIGVWEGSFDSMTVKQVTTLDTLGLFFSLKITLINNSSVPKNDIYYMRSVDPDNDQSWPGGSFVTTNKIEYQLPNALNATMVSATGGTGAMTQMTLGTLDTNAKCLIYNSWPIGSSVDLATVYNETMTSPAFYTAGYSATADVAIGLVFNIPHLAPVDSASDSVGYKTTAIHRHPANEASFTYFYAFSAAGVDSAVAHLIDTASAIPQDTIPTTVHNINGNKKINVYPNPARDVINMTGLSNTDVLMLCDMMGKQVSHNWQPAEREVNTFSMQQIPPGNYILIVKDGNGRLKANVPLRKQ